MTYLVSAYVTPSAAHALPTSAQKHPSSCRRIPDGSHPAALLSIRIHPRTAMHQGALALIDVEREQRLSPTARSKRGRPNAKPLKMVTPNRAHTTTISDLLANLWQTPV